MALTEQEENTARQLVASENMDLLGATSSEDALDAETQRLIKEDCSVLKIMTDNLAALAVEIEANRAELDISKPLQSPHVTVNGALYPSSAGEQIVCGGASDAFPVPPGAAPPDGTAFQDAEDWQIFNTVFGVIQSITFAIPDTEIVATSAIFAGYSFTAGDVMRLTSGDGTPALGTTYAIVSKDSSSQITVAGNLVSAGVDTTDGIALETSGGVGIPFNVKEAGTTTADLDISTKQDDHKSMTDARWDDIWGTRRRLNGLMTAANDAAARRKTVIVGRNTAFKRGLGKPV